MQSDLMAGGYAVRAAERARRAFKEGKGYLLALETSCDETAAAVIDLGGSIRANVVASSATEFVAYGGVVPEIASRRHVELLPHVVHKALQEAGISPADLVGVGATMGPGLVGAVLCGLNYAKAMALALGIPMIGINHTEGHIAANDIEREMEYPHICLTVSGGHTLLLYVEHPLSYRILGRTADDAAGEAFDKVARTLGLEYPGGPSIQKAAQGGCDTAFTFTSPKLQNPYDFSFSGVKTAVINAVHTLCQRGEPVPVRDLAASFERFAVEQLLSRTFAAATELGVSAVAICGGVSANTRLRSEAQRRAQEHGLRLYIPPFAYCTDNAAMIAAALLAHYQKCDFMGLEINANPSLALG